MREAIAQERISKRMDTVNAPREEGIWTRRAVALLCGLLVLRLAYLAIFPADLVHDEAYYWEWSRRLDWGYYSKPPMVAWLIRLSTEMFGHSAFAVRLPAALLSTGGLATVFLLTRAMYDSRVGFWALLLSACLPGSVAAALIMTIDAPLLFCWGMTCWSFWNWLRGAERPWVWLAVATISCGLGLLSKQTMFAFPLFTGLFLLISPAHRWRLAARPYWAFACGSLACLLPVVIWNYQHDWITLRHTSEHFATAPVSWLRRVTRGMEFIGAQFGVLSPVTATLSWLVGLASLRSLGRLRDQERFLLCLGFLPLLLVTALSFRQRVEPNWPAPFLALTVVLAVGVISSLEQQLSLAPKIPAHWLPRAATVGVLFTVLTYALPFALITTGWKGSRIDPLMRLWDWQNAITRGRISKSNATILVTTGRALASELAFYLPDHPRVHPWNPTDSISSQYDVWGPPPGDGEVFVITAAGEGPPRALAESARGLRPLGELRIPIGSGRSHEYKVWLGERLSQRSASSAPATHPRSSHDVF
jgi:4-amino-4-deoxy-L-arabinose transferase-like glycosyltransferase